MDVRKNMEIIKEEHLQIWERIETNGFDRLYAVANIKKRIFVLAAGRSLLMGKAFAMRLMHLGYEVHVLDEVTCPAIGPEDLLIIASGSGETKGLVQKAEKARSLQAGIVLFTANVSSTLAKLADLVYAIPKIDSRQPGASLFEQALLLTFDAAIMSFIEASGLENEVIYSRHANLE